MSADEADGDAYWTKVCEVCAASLSKTTILFVRVSTGSIPLETTSRLTMGWPVVGKNVFAVRDKKLEMPGETGKSNANDKWACPSLTHHANSVIHA